MSLKKLIEIGVPKVAALFVQGGGEYFFDKRIDPWDEGRDARNYSGPLPVIAHPPCQLWGSLAAVNYSRWGGEHNRPGNDRGCFQSALMSVTKFGGVLEHPAKTRAFSNYGLRKPSRDGWIKCESGGWVCEVWQSAYGHKANKSTWLYYFGSIKPFDLDWSRPRGEFQIGYQDKRGKLRNKPTLNKRESNATPPLFKEELIKLALLSVGIK